MQAAQCPSSAAQDARDVADIGVRRLQKFTNVSELWSGRVDPPGPERCRMHRSCGSATTQFPLISETRSMRSRRGTAGSHAGSASHGLGPRRPPTPLRRLRVVARPRRPAAPGRLTGVRYRTCVTSRHEKRWRGGGAAGSEHRRKGWAEANGPNGALPNPATSAGPGPTGSPRPNNALRYSETASANTDLPRHGQPSGGPAHPRDPRATRMHAVLPRPLLSTRVLVLLPPNLPNLA